MRYLVESFAVGALTRGRSVEQFLGPAGDAHAPGVRWVEVVPTCSQFKVVLHTSADIGSENFYDLVEFPSLDPESENDEFGLEIATATAAHDALALAEHRTGAVRGRWVNQGMAQDEYRDFVLAGRSASISDLGVGGCAWGAGAMGATARHRRGAVALRDDSSGSC